MREFTADKLTIKIMSDRTAIGKVAAADIVAAVKEALSIKACRQRGVIVKVCYNETY